MVVYNPLGRTTDLWLRIPVPSGDYSVQDDQMTAVTSQLVPLSDMTKNIPEHNGSVAVSELVFAAADLPSMGMKTFFVNRKAGQEGESRDGEGILADPICFF